MERKGSVERMGSVRGEGLCWRGRALLERKGPVRGEYERAHVPRSETGSTILGQNRGIKKGLVERSLKRALVERYKRRALEERIMDRALVESCMEHVSGQP